MNSDAVIELLGLTPHPEGGFFRETFRARERVQRSGDGGAQATRTAGTAIYFLLPEGTFSAWHRVGSDEAWHHYDGVPLELHMIDLDGVHRVALLGRDFARGERPQHVVPKGHFQAARPVAVERDDGASSGARYALCGCTVSPGFEFEDFEMPSRAEMRRLHPGLGAAVDALTRG